jgi:hypothetical protein
MYLWSVIAVAVCLLATNCTLTYLFCYYSQNASYRLETNLLHWSGCTFWCTNNREAHTRIVCENRNFYLFIYLLFLLPCWLNQIGTKSELCSMHGTHKNVQQSYLVRTEGKSLFSRPSLKLQQNINLLATDFFKF